ncbi:hypothetical protein EB796_021962 [Bugula neritina]|uniref:Uncharacterized protein n=1 Tax=Bugula neritina TaxID=10212 RepID=A0A7J7J221_BUGNE|nr:hypothetical protein EB796_021962 [Bugula neritina]
MNSGNEYELVAKMMGFLTKLSEVCYHRLLVRYNDVFKQLREKLTSVSSKKLKLVVITKHYLKDLVVLSFNGAVYDIPLIPQHMLRYLLEQTQKVLFTAKKRKQIHVYSNGKIKISRRAQFSCFKVFVL